ncbi:MAG TPA: hypothetical protein VIY96_02560 [Thermoanaerobaculia bacterium]
MRRTLSLLFFFATLSFAKFVAAQTVTIGNLPASPNFGFEPTPAVITAIDLANPASQAATLTAAAFSWSVGPCPAVAKIKFFRPAPNGTFILLTERGPFDVTSTTQFVFLSPPVAVQPGDYIGITRLSACGSLVGQSPGAAQGFVALAGDISSLAPGQGTHIPNATLSVQATGNVTTTPPSGDPAAVIPVVGSTPGALGTAFFRTTLQLHNPRTGTISGHLVYHPQGSIGSSSDPSVFYSLTPGETRSIADFLPSIGLTGLGSLDVVPDDSLPLPLIIARVYNDAGSLGTTGFTEEAVLSGDALGVGARGILVAPPDAALYRYNIGVRTLGAGASLLITVRNSGGVVTRSLARTYAANYFEQRDSASFLQGAPVAANDTITIQVTAGSAIVYGATIDNRTNDPSLQLARPAP